MSLPRSDPPFDLPLRSAFCLHQYLLLVYALALQLIIVIDWEAGLSILMIAVLVRHYQNTCSQSANLGFSRLSHLPEMGWQLHRDHDEALSVRIMTTHRFIGRWWMLRLQSGSDTPMTIVLCPDTLDDAQAIVLKQRLLLYREPQPLNEIEEIRS